MKLTIIKNNFKKGLDIIERITGKNFTLPILNNILIKTFQNFLVLNSTDLEIGIQYQTLTKIEKEGQITVPAKTLSSFINFLPEQNIILETKNNILFLSSGNYKSQIKGLPAEDFPIIPEIKKESFIEINDSSLGKGLSQVMDFCSLGHTYPELNGLYFDFQKNKLEIVSTDSFRLAQKILYYKTEVKEPCHFIIPQKAVRELINIISEKEAKNLPENKLKIYLDSNQIMFEFFPPELDFSQFKLISRLIEGEYPDYHQIIPENYRTQVSLEKDSLTEQIKINSLFAGKINRIKIKIDSSKNQVLLSSQNPDLGQNESLLSAQVKGEDGEACFNFKFLLDGLAKLTGSQIFFGLNGDQGPSLLKSISDADYQYIVMPIKIS